jgi:glycine cleavage system H protein
MLRFSKSHEWVRIEGDTATVGITAHAAEQLGDLVFAEAEPAGTQVAAGGQAATVESVKAASEVYSPLSGEIVGGNDALAADPSLINSDPLGAGWLFRMRLSNPTETDALMDEDAYNQMLFAA